MSRRTASWITTGGILLLLSAMSWLQCAGPASPSEPNSPWRVFKKANSPLIDDEIVSITRDSQQRMWIATNNGVSMVTGTFWRTFRDHIMTNRDTVIRQGDSMVFIPGRARINQVVEGVDHGIWFCLHGGGVVRYGRYSDGPEWMRFTAPDLAFENVSSGAPRRTQSSVTTEMWFTTPFGISRYIKTVPQTTLWTTYSPVTTPILPTFVISVAALDPIDSSLWFGTGVGTTVLELREGREQLEWKRFTYPGVQSRVNAIDFDAEGYVWVGTSDGVLCLNRHDGTWRSYTTIPGSGVPIGRVFAVTTNLRQLRWFGTDAGLIRFRDSTWSHFDRRSVPLPSDTVTALRLDILKNLWIGTPAGLAVFNETGVRL